MIKNFSQDIVIEIDGIEFRFLEFIERFYRKYRKLTPDSWEVRGARLLPMPLDLYYMFNVKKLLPQHRAYFEYHGTLEIFVLDFTTRKVIYWNTIPQDALDEIRERFTERDVDRICTKVTHGYVCNVHVTQALDRLGVTKANEELFFNESIPLTQDQCAKAGIDFQKHQDHFYHPFTNILWRTSYSEKSVLQVGVVKPETALVLHGIWRGFDNAYLWTNQMRRCVQYGSDTKVFFTDPYPFFSNEFSKFEFGILQDTWQSINNGKDVAWQYFTCNTTWIDYYCRAKCLDGKSKIEVKSISLAPLCHTIWNASNKVSQPQPQPPQNSTETIIETPEIVPPKIYGISRVGEQNVLPNVNFPQREVGMSTVSGPGFLARFRQLIRST